MSSFLSQAYTPTEVSSQFNTNLALKVLAVKQGTYDQNKAKIDSIQALYKDQLKGLRGVDNEYIAARLSEVNSTINSYANKDYSLGSTSDALTSYLKSITDDPIIKSAVLNKAKFDKVNAEIAEKKKKNDGSYSDINYSYMLDQAGYNAYMKGEQKDLGELQYQNYIDVTKTALDKVKTFKDLRGDETIEIPFTDTDGTKRIRKETVKGLTDSEILTYMPQILSPDEAKQLQINGWARYQGEGGLQLAQTSFDNYKKDVIENIDSNIEKYTTDYNNKNISQEERDKAFKLKTAEEDKKKQYLENFKSIDTENIASIGGFLETQNWKVNFAKLAGAKTSINYDTDSAAYSAANLELAQSKERRENAKFPFEVAKLKAETEKLIGVGSEGVSLSVVEPDKVEQSQPYESLLTDFNKESSNIVNMGATVLEEGAIDEGTKKAYQNSYNDAIKKGYAPATATKIAFSKSGMANLFPNEYSNILEAYSRRGNMASVAKKADDSIAETFNRNPSKYIGQAQTVLTGFNKILGYSGGNLPKTEDIQKQKKLNDFVNSHGGLQNLSQKLKDPKNHELVTQFARLIPESDLLEDAKSRRNEIVAKSNQGIVNTAQIATVTDPKLAEKIINMIPQEQDKVPFNSKQGVTYRATPQGTFEIIQSGAKEGVKGIFGSARTYEVKKGDDLYNVLNSLTLNEAQRREISANQYSSTVNNENIQYIDRQQKSILNTASNFITNTLGANFQMGSRVNPSYFLTQSTTNEVYKQKLKGVVAEDKIDMLTTLMTKDAYNKFTVTATPIQGQWTTSVSLKKGGSPLLLSETSTGKKIMDKQLLLFVKQYPQIMVGEAILEYIQENPKEIDNILNRLK